MNEREENYIHRSSAETWRRARHSKARRTGGDPAHDPQQQQREARGEIFDLKTETGEHPDPDHVGHDDCGRRRRRYRGLGRLVSERFHTVVAPKPAYRAAICVPKQAKVSGYGKNALQGANSRSRPGCAAIAARQVEKRHWNQMVARPSWVRSWSEDHNRETRDWCGRATRCRQNRTRQIRSRHPGGLLVFA